jgi:hypothetical protein
MKKWEYTSLYAGCSRDLENKLNEYGKNGWELVSTWSSDNSGWLHLFF